LGNTAAEALEAAGIICNRNAIPYDPNPPFYPSGLRLGTPAITSQGMKEKEMRPIGSFIASIIKGVALQKKKMGFSQDQEKKSETRKKIIAQTPSIKKIKQEVRKLCAKFPLKKEY